jgi:hypothetical protein
MTDKGMAAINEALTVVEKEPINFTDHDEGVVYSHVKTMKFLISLIDHAVEHKSEISKLVTNDERFKNLSLTEDMTISVYVLHSVHKIKALFEILELMPPGYPPERMKELVSLEVARLEAKAAKYGYCIL